jgi:hypothetical protein
VQHRNENGRPTPAQGLAAFTPQLGRGREGVARNDDRAQNNAGRRPLGEIGESAGEEPRRGAADQRAHQHRPAVKHPRRIPHHPAGDEQKCIGDPDRHRRGYAPFEAPCRNREPTDQIGDAPPRQRANAVFRPGEQQQQSEQTGDASGHHEECCHIQGDRDGRGGYKHGVSLKASAISPRLPLVLANT